MNPSPSNPALASIDAELDERHLAALESSLRAANPRDDQATRLRALIDDQPTRAVALRPLGASEPCELGGRLQPLVGSEHDSPAPWADARIPAKHQHTPHWSSPTPTPRTHTPILTIASGKGGVGKSNLSVNLAIALARRGLRITLLDADLGTANADLLCGLSPSARLDHVLAPGGLPWQDAAHRTICDIAIDAPGGFKLVPGASGVSRLSDLTLSEQRTLITALHQLEHDCDLLLIDAAAGVGRAVTSLMHAADLSLIVTTPEPTALADAYALAKCAVLGSNGPGGTGVPPVLASRSATPTRAEVQEQWGSNLPISSRLNLIINQSRDPLEAFAVHARFNAVAERFLGASIPMLGFIAQDLHVPQAVRARKPLLLHTPDAPAALNICDLAASIINRLGVQPQSTPAAPLSAPHRGISTLVRRLLGFSSSVA